MKKLAALGMVVAGLVASAAAYGTVTAATTSKASLNRAGTKAKPAQFNASFRFTLADDSGLRTPSPLKWQWKWDGVTVDTKDFPTCTAEQIDAAQSDAKCPAGALVGGADFAASFGPVSDKSQKVNCEGKVIKFYNAGANKITFYATGSGEKCAGIGYLAPSTFTLKTTDGTTEWSWDIPANLTHPLPGLESTLTLIGPKFKPVTTKKSGKTVYFMQSTKCTGQRKFTFTLTDDTGKTVRTASAGKCGK